jgi:L-alanine-DL-glutamate epimerase-like enolase superfamily enzyme
MKMTIKRIQFPLTAPFSITGYTFTITDTVRVTLEENGVSGRGEAVGVYYTGDTIAKCLEQLESVREEVERGISLEQIQTLLPSGGARNALDCAYWDLQTKLQNKTIWELLDISPKKLTSVFTLGVQSAEKMAKAAEEAASYPILKIKLDNVDPIGKLSAIRAARPDVKLVVDINQGWSMEELITYAPECAKLGVLMIEQPLKRGADAELVGYKSPVLLGADESCLDLAEYEKVASLYDVINIKLDKCGGLTEGMKIVGRAIADGKALMVGNMTGTSLGMGPAYVIGQFCQFVDIDGPLILAEDVENGLVYNKGVVDLPKRELWG